MIDPLLIKIISLGFALLFLIASAHKFGNRAQFLASFSAYEIVPTKFSGVVASVIPALELLLGLGWLALGFLSIEIELVTIVSIGLLASYALAIGINLSRGRNYIDCGCSFSSSDSDTASQQISTGLLYRNIALVIMAIACTLPVSDRSLQLIDFVGLFFALVSVILIYAAFNQLQTNRNVINSWRQRNA